MSELMKIIELKKYFSGLKAIDGLNLDIHEGETLGIIGPNGAGKTTLFNTICGVYQPTEGKVFLEGKDVTHLRAHEMARLGVARTFQISRPLMELNIFENVLAAAGVREYTGLASFFHPSHTPEMIDRVEDALEKTGLSDFRDTLAANVSLGYLRRLELARMLVTQPRLIMLDEPCAGLSNYAIDEMTELIMGLKEQQLTIVLIEHNLPITMKVCDRITVLNYGRKIAEGSPEEVRHNQEVVEAYLGEEDED